MLFFIFSVYKSIKYPDKRKDAVRFRIHVSLLRWLDYIGFFGFFNHFSVKISGSFHERDAFNVCNSPPKPRQFYFHSPPEPIHFKNGRILSLLYRGSYDQAHYRSRSFCPDRSSLCQLQSQRIRSAPRYSPFALHQYKCRI